MKKLNVQAWCALNQAYDAMVYATAFTLWAMVVLAVLIAAVTNSKRSITLEDLICVALVALFTIILVIVTAGAITEFVKRRRTP